MISVPAEDQEPYTYPSLLATGQRRLMFDGRAPSASKSLRTGEVRQTPLSRLRTVPGHWLAVPKLPDPHGGAKLSPHPAAPRNNLLLSACDLPSEVIKSPRQSFQTMSKAKRGSRTSSADLLCLRGREER